MYYFGNMNIVSGIWISGMFYLVGPVCKALMPNCYGSHGWCTGVGRVGLRILYCLDGDTGPGIEDTICRRLAIPGFIIL